MQPYGNTQEGKNYCIGVWTDPEQEQEAIWDLKYHQFQELLLSLNANNTIVLWDCADVDRSVNCESESSSTGTIRHRFLNSVGGSGQEKATCMAWLVTQQNQFVVGYDSGAIVFFDILSHSLNRVKTLGTAQINTIVPHISRALLCVGHENGALSFFDYSAD